MDLKTAHDFLDDILNKHSGGMLTPAQKDMYLHRAQLWYFNLAYDQYAKSQKDQDSLNVFTVPLVFTTLSDGIIQMPVAPATNPYEHFKAGWIQYFNNTQGEIEYKGFKVLLDDELAERLNSQILKPTTTDPVAEEPAPGQIKLYPAAVYAGRCTYFRTPKAPVFVFTTTSDERVTVYNQGASTQMEWNETSMNKILLKAAQLAGVNLNDELIINYTEQKEAQNV